MSKENEKIEKVLKNADENIKFAQAYLKTGIWDNGKAPEDVKKANTIIRSAIAGFAAGGFLGGGLGLATAGVSASIGTVGLTSTMGVAMGSAFFAPFLTPVLLGESILVTKYLKKRKNEIAQKNDDLSDCIKKIQFQYEDNDKKTKDNNAKYFVKINSVIKKYGEEAKNAGKKISIFLDDAVNVDVNKRILQYQKIVCKLYERQNELDKKLYDVAVAYTEILEENKQLIEKNNKLMALLQALGKSKTEIKSLIGE